MDWLALGLAFPAAAQVVSVAPFRGNDPFVVCTQGYEMTIAQECWVPLPPYTTGAYLYTGVCDPPNEFGRSWTHRDVLALQIYLSACPGAMMPGVWIGPGTGAQWPFVH
jgi:hypothetical protein